MMDLSHTIAELISGLRFKQNKVSWIFDCPRCAKKDKLYIRKRDGRFICFYCAEIDSFRGKAEFALTELLSLPLAELRQKLYGETEPTPGSFLTLELKDWFGDEAVDAIVPGPPVVQLKHDFYPIRHKYSKRGIEYLTGRGITLDLAEKYAVHYCPPARRIIFPVQYHGQVYGWQSRTILENRWFDEEEGRVKEFPKIITSDALRRDQTLMFMDRLDGVNHCVLTEGPISAMKADLCGGNVATMGKAVSFEQIQLLRNAGIEKLYLALDPDAAREVSRLVKDCGDLALYHLLPEADAGDLGEMSLVAVHRAFLNAPRVNDGRVFIFLK